MPRVDEESKLTKAVIALREWLPTVKPYLQERYAFVRETPGLVWRLPEVRYPLIVLGALLAISLIKFGVGFLSPLAEKQFKPIATTGDFHVICTNEQCKKEFVINRKLKFDDFPVECPRCHETTGHRAMRCRSKTCRGKLVPTELIRGAYVCPHCDQLVKSK